MNEPGSFIWTWYGQDEHRWVLLSAEAFLALDFLALDGAMQRETIGSCPGCSTWSEKVVPLHEWLEGCPGRQAGSFRDALRRVWALCNELPEEALGCFDFDIYAHPGWQAVRREARRRCGRTVGTASVATPRSCATTVGSVCMATRRNEKPPLGAAFVVRRTAYSPFFALNSRRRRCRTGSV